MEVNGIAHIFLTASNYERSRDFYRKLLPFLGLKPVIDTETTYYCVGGRTAVGISAPSAEHEGAAFEQKRVGLHHLCFRARERADVDELHGFLRRSAQRSSARRARINGRRDIIRFCSRIPTASGSSSIMCRGRGCWLRSCAALRNRRMGRAKRNPSIPVRKRDGFRFAHPSYVLVCAASTSLVAPHEEEDVDGPVKPAMMTRERRRANRRMVERSDTHHVSAKQLMGIAALHPSYALVVQRCLVQIARASKSSCCHHVMRCLVASTVAEHRFRKK